MSKNKPFSVYSSRPGGCSYITGRRTGASHPDWRRSLISRRDDAHAGNLLFSESNAEEREQEGVITPEGRGGHGVGCVKLRSGAAGNDADVW